MPDVLLNGVRTHFVRAGKGPAVILIHGFSADHAMWWQQIPAFARARFSVIAYDLRGHGHSEHPGSGYNLPTLAADLVALLDALRIERAHLVGLSLGGMIAQRAALKHPDRVRSLTVADSFSSAPPAAVMDIFLEHVRIGREGGLASVFEHLLVHPALPYGPDFKVPLELLPAYEKAFLQNRLETLAAYVDHLAALPDWTAELARISCPTLLVVGDYDTPCIDPMNRIHAAIPGSTLHVIARCGHSSAVEKAGEFNKLVIQFLEDSQAGERREARLRE